jgi:serine/threonine protein kinase
VSRAAAEVGSTANSYEILAKLASGGMADIFLARGEGVAGVERYCVLKRILRDRASDVQFVQMFLDEARLAAQLQHPNIAQVHDIGRLGDSYFFTMEYVHGETVRALLHRAVELQRKLPISCVLTIVAGAAAGLHHAHVRVGVDGRPLGIVHRDVSPSNLMVSYEGSVKLVDFGVAKASDRAYETRSGTVKGKISYLSPEQCRGKRVDRRSDLFSLGICFWEMLTAERLYRRGADFENMNAIVSEPPPPPSSRRADIPAALDELVLRLLAKDPEARCQTADEVVDAVETIAAGTGSVLSASALGRLVRELFGPRCEPWLELERLQRHGEGLTVTGEPIPHELAIPPAERIDHQLAGVLDLSEPRQVTESLDALPAPRPTPTTHLGKPGKRGFPLAAPPPTHPGIDPGLAAGPTGKPGRASTLPLIAPLAARSALPFPGPDDPDDPPGGLAARPHLADPAPPTVPESPRAKPVTSSGVALPAPPDGPPPSTSASGSASLVEPAASVASFVTPVPADPQAAASGAFAAPAGPHATAPGSTEPRRIAWPLVAVVAGAAVLGSVAVVLAMQSGSGPVISAASSPSSGAGPTSAATRLPDRPTDESIDPDPGKTGVPALVAGAGAPAVEPGAPTRAASAAPALMAASVVPGDSSSARGSAPVALKAVPRVPRGSPGARPMLATDARDRPPDELKRLYDDDRYDLVVAQCSKGGIGADHVPLCFLAACHVGDQAAARKLVAQLPASRREQLVTNCKQVSADIHDERCEADPMSCQH